jgi:tetratricopeptide (TPR) repeat protein
MATGERFLFKFHDPAKSVDEFKKVIKIDPWYGQGYMLLGLAQMQLQQWSDAQWAFEEATKVEPGNAKAFLGVGSALNEQHDYAGAQKALEHSLDLNPELAEAHYELARTLAATNKWDLAAPHAQRAIKLNPDYAGPHALMGDIYVQNEEPQAALHEFEEYLRLDPNGSLAPSVKEMIAQLKKVLAEK